MKVIFGLKKIRKFRNPVVALGVFDGVHRGHIHILKEAVKKAKAIRGTSMVLTFWPHPQKEDSLYSLEHRLRLIGELGIDVCVVIRFDRAFSRIPAEKFIRDILNKKIGADYIYVGRNFTFGKEAKGNHVLLNQLSAIHGFKLKIFDVIKVNRRAVSSTYIRRLIRKGGFKTAEELLLRPVSILGTVIRGASLARRLGFPTANIDPHHEVVPPPGVYAVWIILDNKKYSGISSIGTKPTFKIKRMQHIEVHLFNFHENIYGKYLEVKFIQRIRDQKKFSSRLALAQQIKKDIISARNIFSRH